MSDSSPWAAASSTATSGSPSAGRRSQSRTILVSAWTYPENLRYAIIRERHDRGADLPCIPEAARIITAMAAACAELVGASEVKPAEDAVRQMIRWYHDHAVPMLHQAISEEGPDSGPARRLTT